MKGAGRALTSAAIGLAMVAAIGSMAGVRAVQAASVVVPTTVTVKIDNFTFNPAVVTVRPGTTVTWVNGDDIPHTVVARDMSFRSKVLDTGDRFSFTFAKPGSYDVYCSIHPHMTGRVIVSG